MPSDDFASEHKRPTFADDQNGGPENRPEEEGPFGYSGMNGR